MYYYEYQPVSKRKSKADKILKKLAKKGLELDPVVVESKTFAASWWGRAWNKNLESYSDYFNRLGRGRSYLRSGSVLDLRISTCRVEALVSGTRPNPYEVVVKLKPLVKKTWLAVQKKSRGKLGDVAELLDGRFPEALKDLFTQKKGGLFPSPREISLNCSCPDWANMCKHVAAVLYGIGFRLDRNPDLFFLMRNVNSLDLIDRAIQSEKTSILKGASKRTERTLEGADIERIFGLSLTQAGPRQSARAKKRFAGLKSSTRSSRYS